MCTRLVFALSAIALLLASPALPAQALLHQLSGPLSSIQDAGFDLNHDGSDDFLYTNASRKVVVSGHDGSILLDLVPALGTQAAVIAATDDLGISGDGVPDFVAVYPNEFSTKLHAISGADGTLLGSFGFFASPGEVVTFLEAVGDADGDGVGDLIVGTAAFEGCYFPTGSIAFISGGDFSITFFDEGGNHPYDWGAPLGDVNGDGLADFVIRKGCFGDTEIYSAASGVFESTTFFVGGPDPGSASGLGDLNRDGTDDVVSSDSLSTPKRVFVRSGKDWSDILMIITDAGDAVAGPGDVDGDGVVDILATCSTFPGGNASLFSGRTGLRIWRAPQGRPTRVLAVGDVNGDGYADMGMEDQFLPNQIQIWSFVDVGED